MRKVYDCFMFNGEFELLEIRLKTHWDKIDKFVIVEGNRTFSGKEKEYSIVNLPKDLVCFSEKIITTLFDVPTFREIDGSWLACALQRDSLLRGLKECVADDFVIFSEADEIMRPEKITEATALINSGIESVIFNQDTFCYYLNVKDMDITDMWEGQRMLKFETVLRRKFTPQIIRNDDYFDRKKSITIKKSGWHFQNLGGPNRVVKKLRSSCHHELHADKYSNFDVVSDRIKRLIEPLERIEHKLSVVEIDETYPECVYKEPEKYSHLIYKNG